MINYDHAPNDLGPSLQRYIEHGIPPGSFLLAFLCNDLMEACMHADMYNRRIMHEIARWLLANAPTASYGSPENVAKWLAEKRKQHA